MLTKGMMGVWGVVALLLLGGCVDTAGTSLTLRHDEGKSILFEGNARLKTRVSVTAVTYDKTDNGLNRVNVQLTSTIHERVRVQYRIAWYNAEGMEIDGDARTYRPLILQGLDSVTVTGVANSPLAVTSRLHMRELRAAEDYHD